LKPVAAFLVPIFFVLMGIQVHLEAFPDLSVLSVAAGLTIAASSASKFAGSAYWRRVWIA
jgi:Kef-type K+ transport system membrane component KefB